MAIAYQRGGYTHNDGAPTTTHTCDLTSAVAGEVYVILLTPDAANLSITPPSGVTQHVASSLAGQTASCYVYTYVVPSSPPGSLTFTYGSSVEGSVAWMAFTGVDTTTPLDVTPSGEGWPTATTSHVAPAVTTVTADAYVIGGLSIPSGSRAITQPSGWTTRVTATDRIGYMATKGEQASAGTTGTVTIVHDGSTLRGNAWQAALRPSGGTTLTVADATHGHTVDNVTLSGAVAVQDTLHAHTVDNVALVPVPTLLRAVAGIGSSTSLAVNTKTTNATSVRLKVATDTGLSTGVAFGGSQSPDGDGWASLTCTGLSAGQAYYYGVEMTYPNGTVTTAQQGDLKTLPTSGGFTFGFGSCMANGSTNTTALGNLLARSPDLFFYLGDFHYADSTSTSQAVHRGLWEDVFTNNSSVTNIFKTVNSAYIASDHDTGPNGALPGAHTAPNRAARKQVFPWESVSADSYYWTFVVGRVRFIITDDRYERTSTTYIESGQYAWFQTQMQQPEPVKVWVQQGPWNGPDTGDDTTTSSTAGNDKWWAPEYADDHSAIASWLAGNAVGRVVTIHGDAHSLCADDGTNSPGGIAQFGAAPFDKTTSIKGGPYSQGAYAGTLGSTQRMYGFCTVTDDGADIALAFVGYDTSNVSRITLDLTHTTLTVADATSAHTADIVTLGHTLTVADATHGHTVDNVPLGLALTVADATHGHTVDAVALTQHHALTVNDTAHAHTVDGVVLATSGSLVVADTTHAHTADGVALTQHHTLTVTDTLHAHTADNVSLAGSTPLTVQDATHAHTADNVALVVALVAASTLHNHTAGTVGLAQAHILIVASTLHAHTADNVVFTSGHRDAKLTATGPRGRRWAPTGPRS